MPVSHESSHRWFDHVIGNCPLRMDQTETHSSNGLCERSRWYEKPTCVCPNIFHGRLEDCLQNSSLNRVKKVPAEGPLKGLQELHWNGLRPLEKLSQAEEFDKWSGHQLWSPSELDYQATFMAHAELYSMACHYMVDDLKNQAWQRLRAVLIRIGTPKADTPLIGNLMMLASYVYENTADADSDGEEPLRMLVSSFSALHFTAMRGDGFAASMLSGNEGDRKFVVSLMTKVGQRMSYLESPAACKKRSKEYRGQPICQQCSNECGY